MEINRCTTPVTSSFDAACKRARTGALLPAAVMADAAVVARRRGMQLVQDAGDTTQGSHAWSPPA